MNRTNIQDIPKQLFHVRVPVIATYTIDEIEIFGVGVDVNKGKPNNDSYYEFTNVMWNIDKMIDAYIQGYPIKLIKADETADVYTVLEKYLRGQVDEVIYSINAINITDTRVSEIEKFAQEIFNLNRTTISKGLLTTSGIDAFDIGIKTMGFGGTAPSVVTLDNTTSVGKGSYMSQVTNDTMQTLPVDKSGSTDTTYINNNTPDIDFSKIKRRPVYEDK